MKVCNMFLSAFALFYVSSYSLADDKHGEIVAENREQFEAMVSNYKKDISLGTNVVCESDSSKEIHVSNCDDLKSLNEKKCYAITTYEMASEIAMKRACSALSALGDAKLQLVGFIDLKNPSWWKELPAEVIPMPGDVGADSEFERVKSEHEQMVKGKRLGDIGFIGYEYKNNTLKILLGSSKIECGEYEDTFLLKPKLVADIDNDGILEYVFSVWRGDELSFGNCNPGTASSLNQENLIVINKDGENREYSVRRLGE